MPATGESNGLTLASLIGVDYDSDYWDQLLDEMTPAEMLKLVTVSGYGSGYVESVNKPATLDRDGPVGVTSSVIGGGAAFGYPTEEVFASSWNLELEDEFGYFMGNDAIMTGMSGLYAPAVNMHRTPFGGRNFEYYSEDSFQSGIFAARYVKAIQAKGVYCFVKHFALNDQETNRESAATFANEQTIREIYLRPFELTVTEGDAHGMMASKNRIGCVWTGASKALLTDVLRNEWGFVGAVITDSCTAYYEEFDARMALHAGLDMYLTSTAGIWNIDGYETNAMVMQDLRRACHNQLYVVANSLAMNGISATSRVVFDMPEWGIAFIVVDVVLGVLAIGGAAALIVYLIKGGKKNED
jgi:beta-glucosidase